MGWASEPPSSGGCGARSREATCFQFENELELLVHVISRPKIIEAAQRHPDAADWLHAWWTVASKAEWSQLADVRQQYPSADQVDCCLIFDARGNNYRVICRVSWRNKWSAGTLLIKHFLTHAQYDRNHWRSDCR
jgi:mRNA interferase HigB